jgi:hypothetical protein
LNGQEKKLAQKSERLKEERANLTGLHVIEFAFGA